MVNLEVTINQTSAHSSVRQAVLEINGQLITTRQRGNTPQTVAWPGAGASAALQLLPDINNRPSVIRYQGPWAFMQLLRAGNPRQVGDVMQVNYVIGGRNIGYDVRVNALANPFNLSALTQFRCPTGL
jgi:type VI secretion system protein ImpL